MTDGANQIVDLQECWDRVLADDTEALRIIHQALYKSMQHYAFSMLKDEELADDAIQDVFIKAWVKRKKIGKIQNVRAFFYTILRRHNLNQLRSLKNKLLNLGLLTSAITDIEFSPEEIIVKGESKKEESKKLGALLNQLPKRQKEVIYLKYFEELDYREIASVMDINYQSAVNLCFKAIQVLKQLTLQEKK